METAATAQLVTPGSSSAGFAQNAEISRGCRRTTQQPSAGDAKQTNLALAVGKPTTRSARSQSTVPSATPARRTFEQRNRAKPAERCRAGSPGPAALVMIGVYVQSAHAPLTARAGPVRDTDRCRQRRMGECCARRASRRARSPVQNANKQCLPGMARSASAAIGEGCWRSASRWIALHFPRP